MTVNYVVRVPPSTDVLTASDSGATTIRGVAGRVTVRTQSGAIEVGDLGGATNITTGSGAVIVNGSAGALSVITSSSEYATTRVKRLMSQKVYPWKGVVVRERGFRALGLNSAAPGP